MHILLVLNYNHWFVQADLNKCKNSESVKYLIKIDGFHFCCDCCVKTASRQHHFTHK